MTKIFTWAGAALGLIMVGPLSAGEPEIVRMRDQEFPVWPAEDLRERGFDVPDIPRAENAAWVYIDAVNAYDELPKGLGEAFDYAQGTAWPSGQMKLEAFLKTPNNRRALEKLHQGSRLDRCQMPYFGNSNESVIAVLLPSLSSIRFLSKLQVAKGRRLESEERYSEALDTYLTTMRLGEHVGQGITLIEGLVAIAVWALADRALIDTVLRRPLTVAQLEKLLKQLNERAARLPTTKRGLQGERTFGPAIVDEICSRPLRFPRNMGMFSNTNGDWIGATEGNANPHDGWGKLELRLGQLILPDRTIKKHMLDYYDLVLARAERGPRKGVELEFDEEEYITQKIPQWDLLSRGLLPSLSRATVLGELAEVNLAATRTMLAIRIHTLKNDGQPPETLYEIEDKLPAGAMLDPFSGELLRYRPTPDGWLLYSVGPNLTDDDGEVGKRRDDLDVVFRYPPAPIEPFSVADTETVTEE